MSDCLLALNDFSPVRTACPSVCVPETRRSHTDRRLAAMVDCWLSVRFIFHMAPSSCSTEGHEHGLFQKTFAYLLRGALLNLEIKVDFVSFCKLNEPIKFARRGLVGECAPTTREPIGHD
jgi:hypothetical protein